MAARSTNTQTIAFQPAPSKKREGYQAPARHAVEECLSFRVAERDKRSPPASRYDAFEACIGLITVKLVQSHTSLI